MKSQDIHLLMKILVALMCFQMVKCQVAAQYFLNPDFTPCASSPCSQSLLNPWKAFYRTTDRASQPFTVLSNTDVTGSVAANNWAYLKFNTYRVCVYQYREFMPAGNYRLNIEHYIPTSELPSVPANQQVLSLILIQSGTTLITDTLLPLTTYTMAVTTGNQAVPKTLTFSLAAAKQKVFMSICDDKDNGVSPKVSKVHLVQICDESTQVKIILTGDAEICAPKSVLNNINCHRFKAKAGSTTEFECDSCDGTSSTTHKVNLEGGYIGCAHFLIPGTLLYKTTSVVDEDGKKYLTTSTCSETQSTTAYVSIPNYEEETKDETGLICLADFADIKYWNLNTVSSTYVPADCAEGYKFVDLQTGLSYEKGCISQSIDQYDASCLKYKYNTVTKKFDCTTCFTVTNSPSPITKIINGQPINKCNLETCQGQQVMVKDIDGLKFCVDSLINLCLFYNSDGTCNLCRSGAPYNPDNNTCPADASSVVANCLTATEINGAYMCVACLSSFVLDSTRKCVRQTGFCSFYRNGQCVQCTSGFFLSDGVCLKQSAFCLNTNFDGTCIECKTGYKVWNGSCAEGSQTVQCLSNQYKDASGACIFGNVQNCLRYSSPSGQCQVCGEGFKLNVYNQCEIKCPTAPTGYKYVNFGGKCVQTDIQCATPNQDGSCPICNDGFYSANGRCNEIQNTPQQGSQTDNTQDDQFLKSDSDQYLYYLESDQSRVYVTGPWKDKKVWVDGNEELYIKIETIKYVKGSKTGLMFEVDSNGNWKAVNRAN